MKAPTLVSLSAFAGSSLAFGHGFHAPSPWDSRSPCPGLNALANHGYLPHDGKDIDYEMINKVSEDVYGFEPGFYKDAVDMVFQFGISTTSRPNETFNLLDLARHDTIEADGSLTRNDIFFGDDTHFDETVWAPVAKDLGLNKHQYRDRFVTVETAAKATKNRYDLAKKVNPQFNASAHQKATEYGTTALYLLTLWDEDKKAAPKSWVEALMAEDRIVEGYRKGKTVKTSEDLANMTGALRKVVGYEG